MPTDRVTPGGPAFASIGNSYFGPIAVKRGRGREKRNEWMTGRVMDVITGQDGLVRTATVKTRAGTFSRPVVKLCVLEEVAFEQ